MNGLCVGSINCISNCVREILRLDFAFLLLHFFMTISFRLLSRLSWETFHGWSSYFHTEIFFYFFRKYIELSSRWNVSRNLIINSFFFFLNLKRIACCCIQSFVICLICWGLNICTVSNIQKLYHYILLKGGPFQ